MLRLFLYLKLKWIYHKKKNCYYVRTTEFLPPPLSEEEEKKLFALYHNGDMNARNKIIEHNLRLVVYIAKKFESPKVLLEDMVSIGSMGLLKGVQTYDDTKNIKLATYASRCIENEILMFLRKISKTVNEVSLDETLSVDSDGNELYLHDLIGTEENEILDTALEEEKERILYQCIERLKKREKQIMILRFGLYHTKCYTQHEVAEMLGISQSYISRLEKKIIERLRFQMTYEMTSKKEKAHSIE